MLLPTAMHCGALATHVYWTLQTNGHEQGMSNHQTKPNDQKRAPSFPPSLLSLLFALHLNAFACSNGLGNLIPHPCHNHLRHAKKKKKKKWLLLAWLEEGNGVFPFLGAALARSFLFGTFPTEFSVWVYNVQFNRNETRLCPFSFSLSLSLLPFPTNLQKKLSSPLHHSSQAPWVKEAAS